MTMNRTDTITMAKTTTTLTRRMIQTARLRPSLSTGSPKAVTSLGHLDTDFGHGGAAVDEPARRDARKVPGQHRGAGGQGRIPDSTDHDRTARRRHADRFAVGGPELGEDRMVNPQPGLGMEVLQRGGRLDQGASVPQGAPG